MAERKKTPDILADLLGDTAPASQNSMLVKQHAGKTAKQQNAGATKNEADSDEADSGTKVKVTFYLSPDSIDRLEDAQKQLRRLIRGAGKTSSKALTSKSALLEAALQLACDDLEKQGEQSRFASKLF